MLAIEIVINEDDPCIVNASIATVFLTWISTKHSKPNNNYVETLCNTNRTTLRVSGIISQTTDNKFNEFVQWVERELYINDVVKLKMVEVDHCDEPISRQLEDTDYEEQYKKSLYEEYKKEFEEETNIIENQQCCEGTHSVICFDIDINNKRCVTGIGKYGVLTSILTEEKATYKGNDNNTPIARFVANGLVIPPNEQQNEEHVDWLDVPLTVGDFVTIQIVSDKESDEPEYRKVKDPSSDYENRENRRKAYERMKQEYEKDNSEK